MALCLELEHSAKKDSSDEDTDTTVFQHRLSQSLWGSESTPMSSLSILCCSKSHLNAPKSPLIILGSVCQPLRKKKQELVRDVDMEELIYPREEKYQRRCKKGEKRGERDAQQRTTEGVASSITGAAGAQTADLKRRGETERKNRKGREANSHGPLKTVVLEGS